MNIIDGICECEFGYYADFEDPLTCKKCEHECADCTKTKCNTCLVDGLPPVGLECN
jgi:hypothetical protein